MKVIMAVRARKKWIKACVDFLCSHRRELEDVLEAALEELEGGRGGRHGPRAIDARALPARRGVATVRGMAAPVGVRSRADGPTKVCGGRKRRRGQCSEQAARSVPPLRPRRPAIWG